MQWYVCYWARQKKNNNNTTEMLTGYDELTAFDRLVQTVRAQARWVTGVLLANLFLFVLAGAAFGMVVYLMVFAKSDSFSGGDQSQWDAIHNMQHWQQNLKNCTSCRHGVFHVGDTIINGYLNVYNNTSINGTLYLLNGTSWFDVGDTVLTLWTWVLQLIQDVLQLTADVQQLNNTLVVANFRKDVENFVFFAGGDTLPNTTLIPYANNFFFTFDNDPTGVFDNSNENYTLVTRNVTMNVAIQVYFAANVSETYLFCFLARYLNTTLGMEPILSAGVGEGGNSTGFGAVPYTGVVTMTAYFQALAGYELNVRCGVSEGEVILIFATSHFGASVIPQ